MRAVLCFDSEDYLGFARLNQAYLTFAPKENWSSGHGGFQTIVANEPDHLDRGTGLGNEDLHASEQGSVRVHISGTPSWIVDRDPLWFGSMTLDR
jgi:hypothetical protein